MTAPLLNTEETTRPRRPISFRELVGTGFICGSVVGTAVYLPTGGFQAVWTKVPRVSCQYAVFLGAIGAIHRAMVSAPGKEERVLNTAVSMGGAAGISHIPKGVRTVACSALVFGALGGLCEPAWISSYCNTRMIPRQLLTIEFPRTPPLEAQ